MEVTRTQWRTAVRAVADDLSTPRPLTFPPVVGLKELSRMFGVKENTPYQWHSKEILIAQSGTVSNNPVWKVPAIYAWAAATKRVVVWHPWPVPTEDTDASVPTGTPLRAGLRAVVDDLLAPGPLTVPPVVGLKEIGRMFDVKDNTPYQWRSKAKLAGEDGSISNNPVYKVPTIRAWAEATGRVIVWDPWTGQLAESTPV